MESCCQLLGDVGVGVLDCKTKHHCTTLQKLVNKHFDFQAASEERKPGNENRRQM